MRKGVNILEDLLCMGGKRQQGKKVNAGKIGDGEGGVKEGVKCKLTKERRKIHIPVVGGHG